MKHNRIFKPFYIAEIKIIIYYLKKPQVSQAILPSATAINRLICRRLSNPNHDLSHPKHHYHLKVHLNLNHPYRQVLPHIFFVVQIYIS